MLAATGIDAIRFARRNHLPIDITGWNFIILVIYVFLDFKGMHDIIDNERTIFVEFAPAESDVFNLDGLSTGIHDIDDNPLCICSSVHVQ